MNFVYQKLRLKARGINDRIAQELDKGWEAEPDCWEFARLQKLLSGNLPSEEIFILTFRRPADQ